MSGAKFIQIPDILSKTLNSLFLPQKVMCNLERPEMDTLVNQVLSVLWIIWSINYGRTKDKKEKKLWHNNNNSSQGYLAFF